MQGTPEMVFPEGVDCDLLVCDIPILCDDIKIKDGGLRWIEWMFLRYL